MPVLLAASPPLPCGVAAETKLEQPIRSSDVKATITWFHFISDDKWGFQASFRFFALAAIGMARLIRKLCFLLIFQMLAPLGATGEVNVNFHLSSVRRKPRVFSKHFSQSRKIFFDSSLQPNTLSFPESLLFVSTLDGTIHAVRKQNGEVKWSLKEGLWITHV